MSTLSDIDKLKQFIRDHHVSWETHSINETVGGERVPVGFELELHAVCNGTHDPVFPASPSTSELFHRLETLVEKILPVELRGSQIEVLPFDRSVHLDPHEQLRAHVLLKLRIVDATQYFQAADSGESGCLRELEESLKALGARKRD